MPTTITVGGKPFLLETDFRVWIEFEEIIKKENATILDFGQYIHGITPLFMLQNAEEIINELVAFYSSPSITPHRVESDGEKIIDYVEDGEYIYSSFLQAYGIDLLEVDMHWHKFLALFRGLPDNTKIKEIMKYRAYKKCNKSQDDIMRDLKAMWELPDLEYEEEQRRLLEEFNNL